MKQALLTPIYLSALLFLNVELQAQTHDFDYSLEQTSKPAQVRLTNMKIMKENYQLILRGKVMRRTYNSHVIPDHIDYEITDADDMIVDKGVIDTINSLNLRHL